LEKSFTVIVPLLIATSVIRIREKKLRVLLIGVVYTISPLSCKPSLAVDINVCYTHAHTICQCIRVYFPCETGLHFAHSFHQM